MGAETSSEYNTNQGRAPPQGMTYDDVKQAVREVMSEVMGIEGNKNTAEDGGEKFAVESKYWHPNMTRKEIVEVSALAKQQIYSTNNYIDEDNKWLYDDKKGHIYFAIYSTADAEAPTVLYACKADRAEYEHQLIIDNIEREAAYNGGINTEPGTVGGLLNSIKNAVSSKALYARNTLGTESDSRNAGVYSKNRGNRPSKALLNCLENIAEIQRRRGILKINTDSNVKQKFALSDEVDESNGFYSHMATNRHNGIRCAD